MESLKIILTNVTKKEFFPLRLTHIKILLFEDSDNINSFTSDFFVKNARERTSAVAFTPHCNHALTVFIGKKKFP